MRHDPVTSRARWLASAACALTLAGAASAQGFGNEWVGFVKDNARLVAAPTLGLGDGEEKDYAFGDLDLDGWTDLVVARKQPFTTTGRRVNVLLMNEGGTLVDRTAQYAAASDVPGDQGFLTPTNDRDATIVDVDLDGWPDVVTATTLSAGQPKHVSHPRVYMNLGQDANGDWLGLRHEDGRFPQILHNGQPVAPDFCSVSAGDVTGDGYADLYFAHYATGSSPDIDDKLFVNDGNGFFADESQRMTAQMLNSGFGTASVIVDMNLDGVRDVVKDSNSTPVSVSYNDPDNEGFFDLYDGVYSGSPYHANVGDLNKDGRPDLLVSDDGADRYLYNTGTDIFGRVVWGPPKTFQFLSGSDDGFGSNNYIVDLDGDGWSDAIVADVDVDIGGCSRRCHIYHNPGGAVGQQITLLEEAQQSGGGGWKGVAGITAGDLQGMHDVAVFDLDNDGDVDMVFGRCGGTDVWMSTLDPNSDPVGAPYCFCDGGGAPPPCANPGGPGEGCANSSGAGATLAGVGSASAAADDLRARAEGLIPSQPALLFAGLDALGGGSGFAFGDGLRCAGTGVVRLGVETPAADGSAVWGPGLGAVGGWTAGDTRRLQAWYRDPVGGPCGAGFNLTNGLEVLFAN